MFLVAVQLASFILAELRLVASILTHVASDLFPLSLRGNLLGFCGLAGMYIGKLAFLALIPYNCPHSGCGTLTITLQLLPFSTVNYYIFFFSLLLKPKTVDECDMHAAK